MRQITTASELWETLDSATVRGYAVGLLPDDVAPPTAVVWAEWVTLKDATKAYSVALLDKGKEYQDADGAAVLLSRHLLVDPHSWLAPTTPCDDCKGEPPEDDEPPCVMCDGRGYIIGEPTCDPERLRPLFERPADVYGMGSPSDTESVAHALLTVIMEASGLGAIPEHEAAPAELADSIERLRHRGRWVAGCIPQDPEAALWVTPYTEHQRTVAYEACLTPVGDKKTMPNAAAYTRTLLGFVLRTGPGGPPLLTTTDCERLPFGGAKLLEYVSTDLTMRLGGARTKTGFQRGAARKMVDTGGASDNGVVLREATTPVAVAGDGND